MAAYLLPLVALRPRPLLPYLVLSLGSFASFYAVVVPRGLIVLPAPLDALAVDRTAYIGLAVVMLGSAIAAIALALDVDAARLRAAVRSALRPLRGSAVFDRSLEARALRIVACVKIAGLILVLSTSGLSGFDQPKSSWSRAAAWLLAGLLAAALARYGARIVPRSPVHLAVLSLLAATALSALFAEHQYTALFGERGRYLGLSFTLDMAVLYAAVAIAFRGGRDLAALAGTVAAAGVASIAYGLLQRAGLDPAGWGAVAAVRPFSTFGNPDMYGHFLAVLSSAAVAVAAFGHERRLRIGAAGLAAACAILITIIATRGAVLGLAGGLAAIVACGFALRGRGALRPIGVGAAGLLLVTGLVALATPLGARLGALIGSSELADRFVIWDGTWRAFLLRPVVGFGPDNLGAAFHFVRRPGSEAAHAGAVAVDQGHDWVLHALATTGLVGTLALVSVIALTTVALWRGLPRTPVVSAALLAASAAYWAHAFVTVEAVSVSWIPWVVAALAAACAQAPAVSAPVRGLPVAAAALTAALALGLALSGLNAARANDAVARAAAAYGARDASRATDAANEAIALDPGRGEHWNYRGLARGLRGLYALAAADHEEAWRRAPHQTNYLVNLARMRALQAASGDASGGGATAAYAAAQRAISIEPNLASTHRALADVALALGNPDLALTESVAAMRLAPHDGQADAIAAQAAARHPDRARARSLLREALAARQSPALTAALAALQ